METELTAGHDIRAWFTGEDGSCILNVTISPADPSGTESDSLNILVSDLCNYVDQLVELQAAQISSTEAYVEPLVVKHRFLVLRLQRERDPTSACLRLDRRRGTNTSTLRACVPFVETEANDQAMFTIDGNVTRQGDECENKQTFKGEPTLKHLRFMLRIVCDRLGGYKAWPTNCWLFCSVLQELLADAHAGTFELGELQHRDIGREVRRLIYSDYVALVCDALSAAEQGSLQHGSQQINQDEYPPEGAADAPPVTHPEHPTPNVLESDTSEGQFSDPSSAGMQQSPSILHVIPNTGPVAGGVEIAVLGLNFPRSSCCFFGSNEAVIRQWDGGWLACTLPQVMGPGPVDVTIQLDDGSILVASPQRFTYLQ